MHLDVLGVHDTAAPELLQLVHYRLVDLYILQRGKEVDGFFYTIDESLVVEISNIKIHP